VSKFTHTRKRNALADRDEVLHRCRGPRRNHLCRFVLRSLMGYGRGGRRGGGQILGFSIDLLRRPYNILSHYRDGVSKLIGKLRRAITSWECLCVPAAQQQLFPPTFVYVCLNGVPSGFVGGIRTLVVRSKTNFTCHHVSPSALEVSRRWAT